MMSLLITTTLICIVLIIYHHLGYPVLLWGISKWLSIKESKKSKKTKSPFLLKNKASYPSVAVVIPAYNEAHYIAEKIRNLAMLDYPKDRLRVILGCDGCTDKTALIARKTIAEWGCSHLNIEIKEFHHNRGKVAVLNDIMANVDEDLVALSDVSALISIDALQVAKIHFNDPTIGLVTGHYQLFNPGSNGEEAYWEYQCSVKEQEAQLGSVIGAHGAFYMIRRNLYIPLPDNSINDDFIIAMSIVRQGYHAIYSSSINAIELEQASGEVDYHRRSRIAAGNLQQLIWFKELMSPRYRGVAFTFASGKGLRVLMPFLLIGAWIGSILLVETGLFFLLAAVGQSLAYIAALLFQLIHPRKTYRVWQTIHYLVSGYVANLIGCVNYIFRRDSDHWPHFKH